MQAILITMVAMAVFLPTHSNTFDMLEDSRQVLPILMWPRLTHVFIDHKFQLPMLDMEASILLKEMKFNLLKDFIMSDLLPFHSKSSQDLRTMLEVFTVLTTVERLLKMSTMPF